MVILIVETIGVHLLVSLASPVFFGTFATGLLIWATVAVLGHLGGKILWWFLGHLAWVEWLMMKP